LSPSLARLSTSSIAEMILSYGVVG
jgi:hypothetical protein